jgi:hypothetical protein
LVADPIGHLPAIAEVDEAISISDTKLHRRRVGDAFGYDRYLRI